MEERIWNKLSVSSGQKVLQTGGSNGVVRFTLQLCQYLETKKRFSLIVTLITCHYMNFICKEINLNLSLINYSFVCLFYFVSKLIKFRFVEF